jgi:hypothetical protein
MPINNPNYNDISFNNDILLYNNNPLESNGLQIHYWTKAEYISQYDNLKNENANYRKDINNSTYFIRYLNNINNKKNSTIKPHNEDNEQRQLEINNYYILKYKKESDILKELIFFCGLALIGCVVFMKGFISESVYIIYLASIFAIGIIKILYSIYNLYSRDTIRFDETDFSYSSIAGRDMSNNTIDKPTTTPTTTTTTTTDDYICI